MLHKPLVVFCINDSMPCPLHRAVRALGAGSPDAIAVRVLRANVDPSLPAAELWVRVSGDQRLIERLEEEVRRLGGSVQRLYSNRFNTVYRMVFQECPCVKDGRLEAGCPLLAAPLGLMNKSVVVTPSGVLYEYIVASRRGLERLEAMGCRVVLAHGIDEYDYMLSEKQELALIYAYLMGYYRFPRSVSLKALAEKLGLSVSTLAELLRRAEAKVVEAFVRHELPHYLVSIVLSRGGFHRALEERLSSRGRRGPRPGAAAPEGPAGVADAARA